MFGRAFSRLILLSFSPFKRFLLHNNPSLYRFVAMLHESNESQIRFHLLGSSYNVVFDQLILGVRYGNDGDYVTHQNTKKLIMEQELTHSMRDKKQVH